MNKKETMAQAEATSVNGATARDQDGAQSGLEILHQMSQEKPQKEKDHELPTTQSSERAK